MLALIIKPELKFKVSMNHSNFFKTIKLDTLKLGVLSGSKIMTHTKDGLIKLIVKNPDYQTQNGMPSNIIFV